MTDDARIPENSVGVVSTRRVSIDLPPEGLVLEGGGVLPELHAAYETYGALSPEADNVVYICHALTGDAHVAGFHGAPNEKPGWWDAMIGPGKGIDTNRFFVVCANILGGCMGTTGPGSIDPRTRRPYGSSFPAITIGDIVKVQYLLLKQLGVRRLAGVIGGSFGGMQVLEWSIRYPEMVDRAVCIASAMSLSAQALSFDIVGRHAIMSDPAWEGGDYYGKLKGPARGLAQARMIGHITYLSSELMKTKFGREKKDDAPTTPFSTAFQVESYLGHQGEKFVSRFDANSYLHISRAMDVYDLAENRRHAEGAFLPAAGARTKFLVIALSSDWLFPPEQSLAITAALIRAGRRVSYCMLQSPYGHDAFLVEIDRLSEVVRAFLVAPADLSDAPRAAPARAAGRRPARRMDAGDFAIIERMVPAGARVLDLGCGDGELLSLLLARRQVGGLGMDIDIDNTIGVIQRGLDIVQCDIDEGLHAIPDGFYDTAILSQTLQVVRKPRFVISEMLRVAREGVVSFPNFGNIFHRLRLGFRGRMPVSDALPFEWYDTPNIHLATLRDFLELCRKDGIRVVDLVCVSRGAFGRMLVGAGMRNLGSERILVRIARGARSAPAARDAAGPGRGQS